MNFCDTQCMSCNSPGLFPINLSNYHKLCLFHSKQSVHSSFCICLHCNTKALILQGIFLCDYCKQEAPENYLNCSHKFCTNCTLHCKSCPNAICLLCNTGAQDICIDCLEKYCTRCNFLRVSCKHCTVRGCFCEWNSDCCRECQENSCKNCNNYREHAVRLDCGHTGCNRCEFRRCCEACLRCNRCGQEKLFCVACNTLECNCERIGGKCATCMAKEIEAKINSEERVKNNPQEYRDSERNRYSVVMKTKGKCDICGINRAEFELQCGHNSCNKCKVMNLQCTKCRPIISRCASCSRENTDCFAFLECLHTRCKECYHNDRVCRSCKCSYCEKVTTNIKSNSSTCKHCLCADCYPLQSNRDRCIVCYKSPCQNCGQLLGGFVKFSCEHEGCFKCNLNDYCYSCLFKGKKYNYLFTKGHFPCFRCSNNSGVRLFCEHAICLKCKGEINLKKFDYCCNKCLNKGIQCKKCKTIARWERGNDQNTIYKQCCNKEACSICMKNYNFLTDLLLHKCQKNDFQKIFIN